MYTLAACYLIIGSDLWLISYFKLKSLSVIHLSLPTMSDFHVSVRFIWIPRYFTNFPFIYVNFLTGWLVKCECNKGWLLIFNCDAQPFCPSIWNKFLWGGFVRC